MIRSMTAFANSEAQIGSLTINCEVRTVNHRYCDLSFKLPERLRFLETDLRQLISEKIKRGKIECSLNYKKHSQNNLLFNINFEAVKALLTTTTEIEALMTHPACFSALDILAIDGIHQEIEVNENILYQGSVQLVKTTLDHLLKTRAREGKKLQALLTTRCQRINHQLFSAQQRMPEVLKLLRHKLQHKVAEWITDANTERFEQEIVFMLQKLDVTEELERLETHVVEVQRVLQQSDPVGRRLDFLMQEMNREANTLGAKSADTEITQISIELKVLIEQMREQIQNIE